MYGVKELGFTTKTFDLFNNIIKQPYGIMLVTGPTGSGKTTTLYAALQEINTLERNIITLEDPVEYQLNILNQSQVNPKAVGNRGRAIGDGGAGSASVVYDGVGNGQSTRLLLGKPHMSKEQEILSKPYFQSSFSDSGQTTNPSTNASAIVHNIPTLAPRVNVWKNPLTQPATAVSLNTSNNVFDTTSLRLLWNMAINFSSYYIQPLYHTVFHYVKLFLKRHLNSNERGAIVLMIMFGLFLLAAAVMVLRAMGYKSAYAERDSKRAMSAAEAGVERAIYTLSSDSDWSDSTPVSALYTNETLSYSEGGDVPYTGTYTVTLSNRGKDDIKVTSIGTVNNSVRKVMVRVAR